MATLQIFRRLRPLVPFLPRVAIGVLFAAFYGYAKVHPASGWDFGKAFATGGDLPAPLLYLAAWTEFLGGIALVLGFLTRWAALGILCVMVVAFLHVTWGHGYMKWGLNVAWGAVAFCVLVMGPGRLSFDRMLFGKEAVEDH
jgi:putative oxidoreductase